MPYGICIELLNKIEDYRNDVFILWDYGAPWPRYIQVLYWSRSMAQWLPATVLGDTKGMFMLRFGEMSLSWEIFHSWCIWLQQKHVIQAVLCRYKLTVLSSSSQCQAFVEASCEVTTSSRESCDQKVERKGYWDQVTSAQMEGLVDAWSSTMLWTRVRAEERHRGCPSFWIDSVAACRNRIRHSDLVKISWRYSFKMQWWKHKGRWIVVSVPNIVGMFGTSRGSWLSRMIALLYL